MLSTTTMALSTIMPMAMTSAPNDMRCRSIFSTAMKMKVPRITRYQTGNADDESRAQPHRDP